MDIFSIPKASASGEYSERDLKYLKTLKEKGVQFDDAMKLLDEVKQSQSAQPIQETPKTAEPSGYAAFKIPSYTPYKEADIEGGDLASMATVRNLGKFGANIVGGAANIVGGIGNMALHPVDTAKGL